MRHVQRSQLCANLRSKIGAIRSHNIVLCGSLGSPILPGQTLNSPALHSDREQNPYSLCPLKICRQRVDDIFASAEFWTEFRKTCQSISTALNGVVILFIILTLIAIPRADYYPSQGPASKSLHSQDELYRKGVAAFCGFQENFKLRLSQ